VSRPRFGAFYTLNRWQGKLTAVYPLQATVV
jgi:hypothetical protein